MKTLGILLSLLIAGIAAAWFVPAMIWGYQITKESQSLEEGDGSKLAELMKGPAPVKWLRNQKQLRLYYSLEELTFRRTVSYSMEMPFEALLAPGETAPDKVYQELYAMARAPSLLAGFCPELLGTLARKCAVGRNKGSILRDGVVRIHGHLEYIPAYDIGDPWTVKNGFVMRASARVVALRELENTPENRIKAFERSRSLCDKIREKFGNCVITSLHLSPQVYDDMVTFTAMATFAVNADKTVYRWESVKVELDRMAEELLN